MRTETSIKLLSDQCIGIEYNLEDSQLCVVVVETMK